MASPEQKTEPARLRRLNVLVVDDEALLTMTMSDTLRELGHHAMEANSAAEALKLLAENPQIDLIITDHVMPGMTGADLARLAKKARPDLKIILASGYAGLPDSMDIELPRLAKPYYERELVAAIEEVFRV